jgi:hypothetical protein
LEETDDVDAEHDLEPTNMGEIMADAAEAIPGAIENKLEAISVGEIARLDIIAEDRIGS